MPEPLRIVVVVAIAGLWLVSLILPAALAGDEIVRGFHVLLIGAVGILMLQFAWLANLLLVPAVILLALDRGTRRWRIGIAVALVLLALNALTWNRMYYDNSSVPVQWMSGYYVWLAAMALAACALFARAPSRAGTVARMSGIFR